MPNMYYGTKFNNRKTPQGDSAGEVRRYNELKLMQRAGKISNLQKQVKFELIPAQYDEYGDCVEKSCSYIADFVYTDSDGQTVVEDFKGYQAGTAYNLFVIKRKLMYQKYKIRIKEITK